MRFRSNIRKYDGNWHRWFAWLPVHVGGKAIWLEWVEWRLRRVSFGDGGVWEKRLCDS